MSSILPKLSEEYKFICVDFDGTLCEDCWPEIGTKKHYVFDWILEQQKQFQSKIILHTCRCDERLEEAISWCWNNGLELDSVNSNPFSQFAHLGEGPKPYADIYLDDKAFKIW